jgi:hypothetical protein
VGRQELIGSNCQRLAQALARQGRPAEGLPYQPVDKVSNILSGE